MWTQACEHHLIFIALALFYHTKEITGVKLAALQIPPYAKVGDSVTFKCEYDLEQVELYSIKWYWNDEEFYRYVPKESPPFRSFAVKYINVDISKSGENVVTLRGIQRQLTGDYKCEVSADAPLFHTDILVAHMIVVEAPIDPPVLRIEPGKIQIGKNVTAECFVSPSDPAANFTWFLNNEKVQKSAGAIKIHEKQVEKEPVLGLWTSRSTMEIALSKAHVFQGIVKIKCLASIYSVWNGTVEEELRDETPKLAHILESSSFLGGIDSMIGADQNSSQSLGNIRACLFSCWLLPILFFVNRWR